jgi:hypothetical protein
MSLLKPYAYSTDMENGWNIIESGIQHEPLEPTWLHQWCGKWLNIESGITHEPPESPDYNTGVLKDWNIIESGNKHVSAEPSPCR